MLQGSHEHLFFLTWLETLLPGLEVQEKWSWFPVDGIAAHTTPISFPLTHKFNENEKWPEKDSVSKTLYPTFLGAISLKSKKKITLF